MYGAGAWETFTCGTIQRSQAQGLVRAIIWSPAAYSTGSMKIGDYVPAIILKSVTAGWKNRITRSTATFGVGRQHSHFESGTIELDPRISRSPSRSH